MKEVTCICGERVVFLDPEVDVKACPNCGMSVYQYGVPVEIAGPDPLLKTSRRRLGGRRITYAAGAIALAMATAAIVLGVSAVKRQALQQASADVSMAEDASGRGDYRSAVEGYTRAVDALRRWDPRSGALSGVEAALAQARQAEAQAEASANSAGQNGLLPISLEELARQAYASAPERFGAAFERDFAGRTAVIRGRIEQGSGDAYRSSQLTISYHVFGPAGEPVDLAFNGPFFERYRLKPGDDCIIRAVLARMYLDPRGPGETGRWVIAFDGAKSALVTDIAQLKGLGWKPDDEVENLVASQRQLSPAY